MSAHATPASPENDPGHPAADGVAEYYSCVLHELIDVGVELARTLPAQARAQAAAQAHAHTHLQPGAAPTAPGRDEPSPNAPPAPTDIALAYDRITRAVRRTILLARKLAEPAPTPDTTAAQAATHHRVAARRQIIREVEDAIGRTEKGTRADTLHAELLDRLDGPDLDEDINHRPTADIVADICRDLGLAAAYGNNPWRRRTPTDIETLCARAARPPTDPAARNGADTPQPARLLPRPRNAPKSPGNNPASNPGNDPAKPPRHPARPPAALPSTAAPPRIAAAPAPQAPRPPADPAWFRADPPAAHPRPAPAGAGLDPPPPHRRPAPPATVIPYAGRPPDS